MIRVRVRQEHRVNPADRGEIHRCAPAAQRTEAVTQERIGQEATPARFDEDLAVPTRRSAR